jgi:long-chain acyl-CoA synthetase
VVTYEQLDGATARVRGAAAREGPAPGDRVGRHAAHVPYFALAYYGVLRAGGVVVPMNVLLKGREVTFYLTDPEAKLMFAWHGFAEAAQVGAAEAGAEVINVAPASSSSCSGPPIRIPRSPSATRTTPR